MDPAASYAFEDHSWDYPSRAWEASLPTSRCSPTRQPPLLRAAPQLAPAPLIDSQSFRGDSTSSTARDPPRSSLKLLEDFYRTSQEAPEAFRAEYESTSSHILSMLESCADHELEHGSGFGSENALHCAAGCGCLEVCEYLLQRCPKLNFQQDSHGHTPLFWAVRHGLLGAAQLLLRHGAVAQHADRRGLTALHWSAALGYPRLCHLILAAPGLAAEVVDSRCSKGWSTLHLAAYGGSADCCAALEAAGADVAAWTPDETWTPLHLAALRGHAEALAVLIPRSSAEVLLALDLHGRSARDLAEEQGHEAAALVLQDPEEAHQRLVCKWADMLETGGPEVSVADLLTASLAVQAPEIERVGKDAVELSCHVTDLEYRITGYVVEVRRTDGPDGAAPARVYYARAPEQRKLERVQFLVPRLRSNGLAVWTCPDACQFRVTGCCERVRQQLPCTARQVSSEWSEVACMQPLRCKSCKKASSRAASCGGSGGAMPRGRRGSCRASSRPRWPPPSIVG